MTEDLAAKLREVTAENERLRAALANSELPCAYCTLPAEKWGHCAAGFPGCARADDATGCPEFGAAMQNHELRKLIKQLYYWPEGSDKVVDADLEAQVLAAIRGIE